MLDPRPHPGPVEVVEATTEDWRLVRDLRLRALGDAPSAFGSRLEEEVDQPESFWRERLGGDVAATFLALDGEQEVGLVRIFLPPEDPDRAHLVSMWVERHARGRGVGRRLIETAVEWARGRRASSVDLWVTETNTPASRLYGSCGFAPSGHRRPLPSDPSLSLVGMELLLDG
jgi:GNAT superfamily N-acetyltransferase